MLNGGIIYGKHHPRFMQRLLASPVGRFVGPLMTRHRFDRSFPPIFGADTQPDANDLAAYWSGIEYNRGTRVLYRIIRYLGERKRHAGRWVPVLGDAPVPLTFIVGEEDPISGRDMADAFEALGPAQRCLRLPGIGHYPQMEAPEATLAAYLAFRDSIAAR
jgi:pimeloyl-ACP methyl ester carboxylesterase